MPNLPNLPQHWSWSFPQFTTFTSINLGKLLETLGLSRRFNLSAALAGDENHLLNGIWIILMTLEALLVFVVAMRGIIRALSWRVVKNRQLKLTSRPSSRSSSGNWKEHYRPESARGVRPQSLGEWGGGYSAERGERGMWLQGYPGSGYNGYEYGLGHHQRGWGFEESEDGYYARTPTSP
ncbi:hypothetical protein QBC35DRAFT_456900 [Podospora australis]|uniref:Copper transporter n=1 Tax=Podospora australis TaxID=1536484 RepID=A0AAN6WJ23_9PEZI|nr:hypothetical protein QBC35DRAFT_456900 [Podospora australis]